MSAFEIAQKRSVLINHVGTVRGAGKVNMRGHQAMPWAPMIFKECKALVNEEGNCDKDVDLSIKMRTECLVFPTI